MRFLFFIFFKILSRTLKCQDLTLSSSNFEDGDPAYNAACARTDVHGGVFFKKHQQLEITSSPINRKTSKFIIYLKLIHALIDAFIIFWKKNIHS